MKALLARLILVAAALAGAQNAAFAAPDVVVRESADPAKGAVTGQRVAIYVDVLFRDLMAHPPRVEIPDVTGAQIFRFETQGSTMRETIDAASYVGQRFEFAFYARRAGDFTVPPAEVTLLDREGAATGNAKGAALTIGVATPPGVIASEPIVATESMKLEQSWSPDPKGPHKPGDAIVRTLIRTAEDVPALAFADPPLELAGRRARLRGASRGPGQRQPRRPDGEAHRSDHLCLRTGRGLSPARFPPALVGSCAASGARG